MTIKITQGNLGCAFIASIWMLSIIPILSVLYLMGAQIYWEHVWIGPAMCLPVCLVAWGLERWDRAPLKIVAAAIKQNGVIYTGQRHHLIIRDIVHMAKIRPVTGEQGFVASDGLFYNRVKSRKIAVKANQIVDPLPHNPDELFSEELWEIRSS